MPFFGPGGLSGAMPQSESGLDPQLIQQLMAQFPGLQGMTQAPQQPNALQGYQWAGPQFFPGQGQGGFGNLSPFEGAKGFGSESITAGLALGNYGKSSSQQPSQPAGAVAQPFSLGALSLPTFSLPQQVAAQQGGFGEGDTGAPMGGQGEPSGGMTISAGDVLGGADALSGMFSPDLGTQPTTPGLAEQRAGERTDYSNATGSPGGIPQGTGALNPGSLSSFLQPGLSAGTTFSMGAPENFGVLNPSPAQTLAPGTTFEMPGSGPTSFAPGGSAQTALGAGPTDWMGALQSGAGALGGLYNLYGGIEGGDPMAAGAGGLQTIGGLTSLLQSSPQLAEMLGLGGASGALAGVGGAVGGLGGLYGLYQGIQSGDPVQMATGLLSAYMGGSSLVGAITGTTAPGILTGLSTIAPETMAAVASAMTGTTVGASGAAAAISAAAAAYALPVAAIIQAVMDTIAQQDRERVANAGFTNNPIKGALYSASTEGVGKSQAALDALGSDYTGKDTWDLAQTLGTSLDSLLPYFATAQGGRGAIKASDSITGAGTDWSAKANTSEQTPEQYTANFTQAQSGVSNLVKELLARGVPYEALGQLPISGDWSGESLDAGNRPQDMLAKAMQLRPELGAEASQLISRYGISPIESQNEYGTTTYRNPEQLQQALMQMALGASGAGSDRDTKASGLASSMYGGPLWQALARSGTGGPEIQQMIAQRFDPWSVIRTPEYGQQFNQAYNAPSEQDKANYLAQQGVEWQAPAAPTATPGPYANYWSDMAGQRAQQDPNVLAMQQFIQQLQGLQGGLGQINQGLGQQSMAGIDPALAAAINPGFAPGGNQAGAGNTGIDMQALLRQLGLLGPDDGGFKMGGRVPETGSYQLHQGEMVLPKALFERLTQLGPQKEQAFQSWYKDLSSRIGLNPNPDDQQHFYDYRGAFQAGTGEPGADQHFTSRFKTMGHPNQYIDNVDTRSGAPINTRPLQLGFPG